MRSEGNWLSTQLRRVLMIEMMRRVFKTLWVLLALTTPAAAADLPKFVEQALRDAGIPKANVSIVVQEVTAPRPQIAHNAATPMNPASVMKLVTTYAGLELLGPAYRWKTEAYTDGDGLVLKGYGDPKLNLESFWLLLRNLRARGLRDIQGDIVLDRSYFAAQPDLRFDDDTYRPYNVAPDALLVNFKTLRFNFMPQAASGTVRVFVEPPLPGLELVNTLRLVESSGCPEGRAFRDRIQAEFRPRPPRAALTGPYPAACGEREMSVAQYHAEDCVTGRVRQVWAGMGGWWGGTAREGAAPPAARPLCTHESEPLAETVRDINKFSNNVVARQLSLTIGGEMR